MVAVSSVSTVHGAPRAVPYAASKGAIGAMVKALSVELARHGIRVNSVVPGWIEVERTSEAMNAPRFSSKVMPRVPLRRWGTPSDIGPLAVYLAGPASSYVTGASFLIDGGYTVF